MCWGDQQERQEACFLWGEPRRKLSCSTVLICFLSLCLSGIWKLWHCFRDKGKRGFSLMRESFYLPLQRPPVGVFHPFVSFLSSSAKLTCHLVVCREDMTSDFESNIPALTDTETQTVSVCPALLSFHSLSHSCLFFFSSSVSLCLSVLLVEGSGNHMVELLVWEETRGRKTERETDCHTKKTRQTSHAQDF